jgi:hypothetical protein
MQLAIQRRQTLLVSGKYHVTFHAIKDGESIAECGSWRAAESIIDQLWDDRPQSDRIAEMCYPPEVL